MDSYKPFLSWLWIGQSWFGSPKTATRGNE
jgi:hypothetical protein